MINLARGHESHLETVYGQIFFPALEGGEKTRLGDKVRREERLLSRTAMSMDRVRIVDDLSEGAFRLPYPLAPAPPESHMSKCQACPTRQAQADKPSLLASPPRLEQAAYRGD
jgi:hypothetical protein